MVVCYRDIAQKNVRLYVLPYNLESHLHKSTIGLCQNSLSYKEKHLSAYIGLSTMYITDAKGVLNQIPPHFYLFMVHDLFKGFITSIGWMEDEIFL